MLTATEQWLLSEAEAAIYQATDPDEFAAAVDHYHDLLQQFMGRHH